MRWYDKRCARTENFIASREPVDVVIVSGRLNV
jgi:hypothetical protein